MLRLEKGLNIAAACATMLMTLLISADVLGRHLFRFPIHGAVEISEFLMVFLVFLSLPLCQSEKQHITINVLTDAVRKPWRRWLDFFALVVSFVILLLITWRGGVNAFDAWREGQVVLGTVVMIPLWPAKIIIPIGAGLACLRTLIQIIKSLIPVKPTPLPSPSPGQS